MNLELDLQTDQPEGDQDHPLKEQTKDQTKTKPEEPKLTIDTIDTSFQLWPKTPRWSREVITVTEKIDGTNAQLLILPDGQWKAGSRNRWLSAETDNYGFYKWCSENIKDLSGLGLGRHYGEWWGQGIQRNYGLSERRFSLFKLNDLENDCLPPCVNRVPVMYRGPFDQDAIDDSLLNLYLRGSVASPGFMKPEGIVIHQLVAKVRHKWIIESDKASDRDYLSI